MLFANNSPHNKTNKRRISKGLSHVYIDAFAGAGFHLSKTKGEMVRGSPLNALLVQPPFKEYHLIDLNGDKVDFIGEPRGNA